MNTITETGWVTVSNRLINIIEETLNLQNEKDLLNSMFNHITIFHTRRYQLYLETKKKKCKIRYRYNILKHKY